MDYQKWFFEIYYNVLIYIYGRSYYVFLCGGAGIDSIRNKMRPMLEKVGWRILYPEDVFADLMYKDKSTDLLTYENFLAKNSNVVCVVCESPGSFAELGAFVQSEKINDRLVVAVDYKHKRDKSFIMKGPVQYLKIIDSQCVVYFKRNELNKFTKELNAAFTHIRKKKKIPDLSFENLSTYILVLPVLLFFFQRMERTLLFKELKCFLNKWKMLPNNYNVLFNSALRYLIKAKIVAVNLNIGTAYEELSLTKTGDKETRNVMSRTIAKKASVLNDRIRCGIMYEQLNS